MINSEDLGAYFDSDDPKRDSWLNEVRRIGEEERWCFYPEDWLPFFSLGVSPQDAVDYKLRGIALKLKPHEQSFAA